MLKPPISKVNHCPLQGNAYQSTIIQHSLLCEKGSCFMAKCFEISPKRHLKLLEKDVVVEIRQIIRFRELNISEFLEVIIMSEN